jgi:hypothetical protein
MISRAYCPGKDMLNKKIYFVKDHNISFEAIEFAKVTWKTITIPFNRDDTPILLMLKMGGRNAFILIHFEIYCREAPNERPITYELAIALDASGRSFVESEVLKQRRRLLKHGRPYPFLRLNHGKGMPGYPPMSKMGIEENALSKIALVISFYSGDGGWRRDSSLQQRHTAGKSNQDNRCG